MTIERLDGFTAEGLGNFIPGEIQDGDVVRIDGRIEQRYYAPVIHEPQPNNPGNPYFGKKILETKDFFALVGTVLGSAYPRLRNDAAFLWVYDLLMTLETVNPDDKAGQFLQIVAYLTNTNASDGQKLMSAQDVTDIMAAWPESSSQS